MSESQTPQPQAPETSVAPSGTVLAGSQAWSDLVQALRQRVEDIELPQAALDETFAELLPMLSPALREAHQTLDEDQMLHARHAMASSLMAAMLLRTLQPDAGLSAQDWALAVLWACDWPETLRPPASDDLAVEALFYALSVEGAPAIGMEMYCAVQQAAAALRQQIAAEESHA